MTAFFYVLRKCLFKVVAYFSMKSLYEVLKIQCKVSGNRCINIMLSLINKLKTK